MIIERFMWVVRTVRLIQTVMYFSLNLNELCKSYGDTHLR